MRVTCLTAVDAAGARHRGDDRVQVSTEPVLGALQREHADQNTAGGGAQHAGHQQEHAPAPDRADGGTCVCDVRRAACWPPASTVVERRAGMT